VDDRWKNPDYDPQNLYSVPYSWGTVGIIYNSKYVDEADVIGWELLWNEKYADKILMFDNSRDAFGIAQCLLGYSLNTTDPNELKACADKLKEQKPVVQQYIMDQVFDLMENEEAWIAPYYAGDYLTMSDENEALEFYLPENQGFNRFVDAMCIPKCAKEKEAAELFINFLCDPEIAGGNMDWICYSTPVSAAKEYMDPEVVESDISYPSDEVLDRGTGFLSLPVETTRLMEELFMAVRNGL
jgi:spermidine/putrescine transport system substrate-binding protein